MDVLFESRYGSNHFCVAVSSQRVSQYHRHHGSPEADVLLLALGLLVELHDAELELEQRAIDVLGLLNDLFVIVACFVHSL